MQELNNNPVSTLTNCDTEHVYTKQILSLVKDKADKYFMCNKKAHIEVIIPTVLSSHKKSVEEAIDIVRANGWVVKYLNKNKKTILSISRVNRGDDYTMLYYILLSSTLLIMITIFVLLLIVLA